MVILVGRREIKALSFEMQRKDKNLSFIQIIQIRSEKMDVKYFNQAMD